MSAIISSIRFLSIFGVAAFERISSSINLRVPFLTSS
jgi:hypothetical protein